MTVYKQLQGTGVLMLAYTFTVLSVISNIKYRPRTLYNYMCTTDHHIMVVQFLPPAQMEWGKTVGGCNILLYFMKLS